MYFIVCTLRLPRQSSLVSGILLAADINFPPDAFGRFSVKWSGI